MLPYSDAVSANVISAQEGCQVRQKVGAATSVAVGLVLRFALPA